MIYEIGGLKYIRIERIYYCEEILVPARKSGGRSKDRKPRKKLRKKYLHRII